MPCTKSGNSCAYPSEDPSADNEAQEDKAEMHPSDGPQLKEGSICENVAFPHSDNYQQHLNPQVPLVVQGTSTFVQNPSHRSAGVQTFNDDARFFQPGTEPQSLEMIPADIVSYPTTSPTNAGTDFSQSVMGYENQYMRSDFNFMTSNPGPRVIGMAEGGVDWLGLELDSPNNGDLRTQNLGQVYSPSSMQFMPTQFSGALEEAMHHRNHSAVVSRFDQMRAQIPTGAPSKPPESQAAAQQWPFDHTRNPEPQKYQLPPLKDILQGALKSSETEPGSTIKSLVQLLSAPFLPEIDMTHDISMMSAMDLLKNSLDLYFSEFHSVLPLVHIPTFNMHKVPTVTLAAMSCIGAMYSDDRQGTEQASSLSEMCIQMIAWLVRLSLTSRLRDMLTISRAVPIVRTFTILPI
jgi:hypothetical protein